MLALINDLIDYLIDLIKSMPTLLNMLMIINYLYNDVGLLFHDVLPKLLSLWIDLSSYYGSMLIKHNGIRAM